MGIFNRGPSTTRRGVTVDIKLDAVNVIILVIMSLILIQGIGLVFGDALGFGIALGPLFILISVGLTAVMGVAIFKKLFTNTFVTKQDILAIVIIAFLTVLLMFFLRDFVPEVFEQSIVQLQSVISP